MSKIGQTTSDELCKPFRYVTSNGSWEETIRATNLKLLQEMSEDTTSEQNKSLKEGPKEVTAIVRS